MGLVVVLVYVALYLLSPVDIVPALAPYRVLLVLAGITVLLSIVPLLGSQAIGRLRTQFSLVVLLCLYILASWLPHGWLGGTSMAFQSFMPNVMLYFVGIVHFHSVQRLSLIRFVLVLVALYILATALSQVPLARATGQEMPYVMGGTDVRIRGLGVLHDPNSFGQYLLMLLPMLFVSNNPKGMRLGYLLAVPLTVVFLYGIYMTNSRGTVLGTVLLIGLYLSNRYKKRGVLISAVIGALLLLVLNATRSRTISISSGVDRLAIWSDGLGMFKSSPLWGVGYYGFMGGQELTAHNSFLLAACELGLMGYFLWMSVMVVTLLLLQRAAGSAPKMNLATASATASIMGSTTIQTGTAGNRNFTQEPPRATSSITGPGLTRWAEAIRMSLYCYLATSFFISRTYDLPLYFLLGMAGAIIASAGGEAALPLKDTKWPLWAFGLCIVSIMAIYIMVRLRVV